MAEPPSFMVDALSDAFSTILVPADSPPPPPPAGMLNSVMTELLLLSCTVTVPSSFSMTSLLKRVPDSSSDSLAVTTPFCTGLVLEALRLSSTSTSSMVMPTLPSASGVFFSPLTVMLLTVFFEPYSSHAPGLVNVDRLVPMKR